MGELYPSAEIRVIAVGLIERGLGTLAIVVSAAQLTVAVTGVTGTVGRALLPFLEESPNVRRVVGLATRPWDPRTEGFTKIDYRRVDVRDADQTRRALRGADVVVHLAFSLYGLRQRGATLEQVNLKGSTNVLAAARAVGARRFVYTSSAAVYGFGNARPEHVDETAALERAPRHFYTRHKAAVERALVSQLARQRRLGWTVFRPCAVVGPHAIGAASHVLPSRAARAVGALVSVAGAAGLRPPVPGPPIPMQFVHERDVAQAIVRAISANGTSGIYNLAGDGMVAPSEIPRLLGLRTLPLPSVATRAAALTATRLPYVSPGLGWTQLFTRPLHLDTSRAKRDLGWQPEFTSEEALASTRRALGI